MFGHRSGVRSLVVCDKRHQCGHAERCLGVEDAGTVHVQREAVAVGQFRQRVDGFNGNGSPAFEVVGVLEGNESRAG